jgi:hypothetical protein
MDTGQLIVGLISVIVMLIPIGGLLWKISKIVFQVEINRKDINNLSQKLIDRVDKIDQRFIENEAKLSNIAITMGRMEEKINVCLNVAVGKDSL